MSGVVLRNVSLRLARSLVIQNLSLTIEQGSSLGLIGPNGCGKSTLLKLMASLLKPTTGAVLIDGFDTSLEARRARRRIGYVPDRLGIYPGLTVWQYLGFFSRAAGVPAMERKSTQETLLRVVDLFDQRQELVERLSRGMLRRLALARALVHNPAILLLDDPLGGLDGRGRLEISEVLKELRGMGLTLVMSGHLLGDIVDLCTEIAIMREGHLIRCCPVTELQPTLGPEGCEIEAEVLLGGEQARSVLSRDPNVRGIESNGVVVTFQFHNDAAALAALLDDLIKQGVQLARFGPGARRYDELAASLVEGDKRETGSA